MTKSSQYRQWGGTAAIALVVALSIFFFYPLNEKLNLGLDLRGGVMLLLEAQIPADASDQDKGDIMDRIVTILENRVNQLGLTEPVITPSGDGRVMVQLPGTTNPETAKSIVGQTALLEFKKVIRAGVSPGEAIAPTSPLEEVLYDSEGIPYLVEMEPLLTGAALANATAQVASASNLQSLSQGRYYVALRFNDNGAYDFTSAINRLAVDDRLAIVLDGVVQSSPSITQGIKDEARRGTVYDAIIQGYSDQEHVRQIAIVLRAGALPVPVQIIQNVTVGPSLGQDSIEAGINATILAGILVLLFMAVYYRFSGVIADLTVLFNLVVLMGALAALDATLTLPGIAGIILTVGMGVDSNVLILERMREELKGGKTVNASIDAGYNRALLTIIDSHVTTLITAVFLFLFGTGPIRGFAVTLSLGIVINLFTVTIGTRTAYEFIKRRRLQRLSI